MKRFAKLLFVTLGFGVFGFAMSLVPQKTATGAGGAPVTVMNTPLPISGTVGATQSGAWSVGINGTPSVSVASLPAITGNVNATITGTPSVNVNFPPSIGVTGSVQVINSPGRGPNDEPEPTALLTLDETNPAFEPYEQEICFAFGSNESCPNATSSQVTVPSKAPDGNGVTRLVIDYVSGFCSSSSGQVYGPNLATINANQTNPINPWFPVTNFSVSPYNYSVFSERTEIFLNPGQTFVLESLNTGSDASCTAQLSGHFVIAPAPVIP